MPQSEDAPGAEIHKEHPFVTPADRRTPARRLRGRLSAPVTVWTSGTEATRAALTVSSIEVAEGEPSLVLGLVSDTTDLWEQIETTRRFVVHVLEGDDATLAEIFAGRRPNPGGPFAGLEVEQDEHGPVVTDLGTRAYCRLLHDEPAGYQRLVVGAIDEVSLTPLTDPLVYFRGRYRRLEREAGS